MSALTCFLTIRNINMRNRRRTMSLRHKVSTKLSLLSKLRRRDRTAGNGRFNNRQGSRTVNYNRNIRHRRTGQELTVRSSSVMFNLRLTRRAIRGLFSTRLNSRLSFNHQRIGIYEGRVSIIRHNILRRVVKVRERVRRYNMGNTLRNVHVSTRTRNNNALQVGISSGRSTTVLYRDSNSIGKAHNLTRATLLITRNGSSDQAILLRQFKDQRNFMFASGGVNERVICLVGVHIPE